MKMNILFIVTSAFISSASWAASSPSMKDVKYTISPLFGFETVYRDTPTPHTATHMMYGARVTAGIPMVSAELEYTKGSDTENFAVAPEKVSYTDEKVKLGLRSVYGFAQIFTLAGRLGGQAKKTTEESTSGGITTTTEKPIEYAPYAGAAFGVHFGKLNISIGCTAVIKDTNDMTKNEYQNTISVGVGI